MWFVESQKVKSEDETKEIFEEIMVENFLEQIKDTDSQILELQ